MEQQARSLVPVTLLRHARRALLLVGGVFVWWLVFLAGGAAHADDTGGVGQSVVPPTTAVAGLVDTTTGTVTGALRSSPSQVTHTVDAATSGAPAPERLAVQSLTTTLEPGLSLTTTEVADVVDGTVAKVETLVVPVVAPRPAQASSRVASTQRAHHVHLRATRTAAPSASAVADHRASSTLSAAGPTGLASPYQDNGSAPGVPGAPGLPGGSSGEWGQA